MSVQEQGAEVQHLLEQDRNFVWHPMTQHQSFREGGAPLVIVGGEGSVVRDIQGRTFLDAAAGLWCVNVGYGRPELVNAAMRQMNQLAYYPLTQSHPTVIELSAKLASYLPYASHLYYSNSGSEANELAFKAVRQYWRQVGRPEKIKIISRHRGYHGTTLGALSATGQNERKRGYGPLAGGFVQVSSPYCYRCPFHLRYPDCALQCADDFERRIQIEDPDTVAAIIVEPVIAGGGVIVPPDDYLQKVSEIAKRYDAKLIVDEVVTGFGRVGGLFAHQEFGVVPDVITMAKGLASGYMPIGATALSDEIFEGFMGLPDSGRHLRHVNTYSGHPVATAVALANIELLEEEHLPDRSQSIGQQLLDALRERLADFPCTGDVRGRGLLVGVELVTDRQTKAPVSDAFMRSLARELLNLGVIGGKATDVQVQQNNILMFAPPLVITETQVEQLVTAVRDALQTVLARGLQAR